MKTLKLSVSLLALLAVVTLVGCSGGRPCNYPSHFTASANRQSGGHTSRASQDRDKGRDPWRTRRG